MPHNGITYRGKHSDEFGAIVKTVGRPIIAPVKQVDEEVAYRDGNVDYSEAGGRLYYEDNVLELEFTIRAMNTTELHKKVSRMINWLSGGYDELIFDDMPAVAWIAKPVDLESLSILLYKNGRSTIQFRCRPFNRFIYDSQGIPLGAKIQLGAAIPLGMGKENNISFAFGTTTATLNYFGSAPIRPKVAVTRNTSGGSFSIEVNGVEAGFSANAPSSFEIDCENAVMPSGMSGDFFELVQGENAIEINSSCNGEVKFEYKHNFYYGDGF